MNLTQSKFKELIQTSLEMLEDIGYSVPDYKYEISTTTNLFGKCSFSKRTIYVSKVVSEFYDEDKVLDTIIHEMCHAITPKSKHTGRWKEIITHVNSVYDMSLQRCYTPSKEQEQERVQIAKYIVLCDSCKKEIARQKMSNVIKHTSDYRCKCGGKLTRIK